MLALLVTAMNYLVLTGYDSLSVLYAKVDLSYGRVALASTLGFALSQTLGFPVGGVLLTVTSPLGSALPPLAIRAGGALMLGCAVAYLALVLRGRSELWHRFGDILLDHGERFYNFQGLYDFKEKFEPEWESRYLAVSSIGRFPQTLADVAALVGGGLKGVLGK